MYKYWNGAIIDSRGQIQFNSQVFVKFGWKYCIKLLLRNKYSWHSMYNIFVSQKRITSNKWYIGDLNTKLVWYSNSWEVGRQMVHYWNTGQKDANFFICNCPAYEYERIFLFASRILQKRIHFLRYSWFKKTYYHIFWRPM